MYEYYRRHCPIEVTKKRLAKEETMCRSAGKLDKYAARVMHHNSCQLCPF